MVVPVPSETFFSPFLVRPFCNIHGNGPKIIEIHLFLFWAICPILHSVAACPCVGSGPGFSTRWGTDYMSLNKLPQTSAVALMFVGLIQGAG